MVKEIMSLLSLQLMYSYLNKLTLYAGVLYIQPSWYSFSSWPHIDITPLGHSVTWPRLFLQQRCFWDRISNLLNSTGGIPPKMMHAPAQIKQPISILCDEKYLTYIALTLLNPDIVHKTMQQL